MTGHAWTWVAAFSVTASVSCGPRTVVINGVQMTAEEAAAQTYKSGREARDAGDNPTAKQRFREVVNEYADSRAVPDALADLGAILLAEGGCRAARNDYENLAEKYPLSPRAAEAKDVLGRCEGERSGAGPAVPDAFTKQFEAARSDAERQQVASSAADAATAAGDFAGAVRWLLRVLALEKTDAQKTALRQEIADLIDTRVSFQDVRRLLEDVSGKDFPKNVLTYKLGRIQYHIRDLENAQETLRRYLDTWPGGQGEAGAKRILGLIEARKNVKPRTIGVVLPLSGKFRNYGENALQAVQLALEADETGKKGLSGLNVVVKDSKGERAAAAQAVQDLTLEDGAIAIVGPMFTSEALAAGYKAQSLGVPLMTIGQAEEIGTIGPYVFRNGLTTDAQAKALVSYAMDSAKIKTFAVLYPRLSYGENFVQGFWDEVDRRKGEIRGIESYSPEDTQFPQVKSLVARDLAGMRGDFRKAVEECDQQPDNYRRARCREHAALDLKPIIDFDALFIPDYEKSIALISAAIAFEDIIVETDKKNLEKIEKTLGHKITPVTLLGGSGWNSQELVDKAKRNVESAVFTEAFFAGSNDSSTAQFVNAYQKRYNRTPRTEEALIYDSARILRMVVDKEHPENREAMREALRHVVSYPGVTGHTSFAQGPDAQKEIRLLTIKNGQIQELAISKPQSNGPEKQGAAGRP